MVCYYKKTYAINAPIEKVWAFFEREDAFEKLNPPWAKVQLIKKTGGLQTGAEVCLKLPFGLRWTIRHVGYQKHCFFIDAQVYGPFRMWEHRHQFDCQCSRQTLLTETITFSLPVSWLSDFLFGGLIKKRLDRLFAFRQHVLEEQLVPDEEELIAPVQ